MPRYLTGRKLSAKAAAVTLCITSWNLNPTNDVQEVTNSCSNGNKEWDEGLNGGDGSVVLVWDAAKNPFESAGGGLKAGAKVSFTLSLESGETSGDFVVPGIITGTPLAVAIGSRVELTVNFNINGAITYPTGTIDTGGLLARKGSVDKPVGWVMQMAGKDMPVPPYRQMAEIHSDMAA